MEFSLEFLAEYGLFLAKTVTAIVGFGLLVAIVAGASQKNRQGGDKGELKIILVYAPWCGHSKKMLGDYERVKSEFDGKVVNGNKVSIIMYNSDVDKDKVKEYGVKGFPTLFVEKNGNRQPFPHRSYDKISEYIKSA